MTANPVRTPSTADLCDEHADRLQVCEPVFLDFGGRRAFSGPASTVRCFEDNRRVREAVLERDGCIWDLVVSSEVGVTLALQGGVDPQGLARALAAEASVEIASARAIVCVVGAALAHDPAVRVRVLSSLAEWEPELVAVGGSGSAAAAVISDSRLEECVRGLHRRFFEEGPQT